MVGPLHTRRDALRTSGVAIAGFLAGCKSKSNQSCPDGEFDAPDDAWIQPQYDGARTNRLPRASFNDSSLELTWRLDLPSYLHEVVSNGRFLFCRTTGDGQALYAVSTTTGTVEWRRSASELASLNDDMLRGWLSTPVVTSALAFVVVTTGESVARSPHTVEVLALNVADGSIDWRTDVWPVQRLAIHRGGRSYIVEFSEKQFRVRALNPHTGMTCWSRVIDDGVLERVPGIGQRPFVSESRLLEPAIGDRYIYLPYQTTNEPTRSRVLLLDRQTGDHVREIEIEAPLWDGVTVANGRLYATSAKSPNAKPGPTVFSINVETGGLQWTVPTDAVISRLAVSSSLIWWYDDEQLIGANPETGRIMWNVWGRAVPAPQPAMVGERLFTIGERPDSVYVRTADTGQAVSSIPIDSVRHLEKLYPSDGSVYVLDQSPSSSQSGQLVALR